MARATVITWQPLTQWPTGRKRTTAHEDANFTRQTTSVRTVGGGQAQQMRGGRQRMPLTQTLEDLDRELYQISAKDIVVQIDVAKDRELSRLSDLTNVSTPAVVLTFKRNGEPFVFACDYFKRWQDNLRAIAKGLESLRLLERYHITQSGEQYRGWRALPAATTTALSTEQAASVIARRTGENPSLLQANRDAAKRAIRRAAAGAHPDSGGSTTDFQLVQEAKRVLETHHGATL